MNQIKNLLGATHNEPSSDLSARCVGASMKMRKKPTAQRFKRRKQSIPLRRQTRVKMHQPSFRWQAYRQSRRANSSRFAAQDQAWVDAMIGDQQEAET
jgi:hypothetical protein